MNASWQRRIQVMFEEKRGNILNVQTYFTKQTNATLLMRTAAALRLRMMIKADEPSDMAVEEHHKYKHQADGHAERSEPGPLGIATKLRSAAVVTGTRATVTDHDWLHVDAGEQDV